jgi:oxygen-independent coproporphyrinogen III oxidase
MAISLYIHFPFCSSQCHYCDFYKEPYDPEIEEQFGKALLVELRLAMEALPENKRKIETIYIGGGTPSLIDFWNFKYMISMIREYFEIDPQVEFSFEINPESIDDHKLLALKELGVNRPIFGIQSFNPKLLKHLNRRHNLNDSFRAVYLARATGYDNFGMDMIFGFPGQTTRKLSDDLDQLIDLAPPHISYYQLTVEKDTTLAKKIEQGKITMPDEDLMAAMYQTISRELKKHSYNRYEISSFAIPGFECKHNRRYWEGGDYLGLGPSAHSFINGKRFSNSADLREYIKRLSKKERPLIYDRSGKDKRMLETIMLSLRTSRGLERNKFMQNFGVTIEQALDGPRFKKFIESNLIVFDGDNIRLTEAGFPVADEIIGQLVK